MAEENSMIKGVEWHDATLIAMRLEWDDGTCVADIGFAFDSAAKARLGTISVDQFFFCSDQRPV
jgi:hypothetical protein